MAMDGHPFYQEKIMNTKYLQAFRKYKALSKLALLKIARARVPNPQGLPESSILLTESLRYSLCRFLAHQDKGE